jgi:FkbM family methyltransferase
MQFFSQVGQDRFLFENFFYGHRGGTFVDVGAYDGEKFSNTLFFERYMDWSGLCIEPLPSAFEKLAAKRKAICKHVCVGDFEGGGEFTEAVAGIDERMLSGLTRYFDPRHSERLKAFASDIVVYDVPVRRLSSLLTENSLLNVDYCSIDTEGSEFNIISDLDFEKFSISVLTIENNYGDERIPRLMAAKGYDFVAKLEQDYVFKRRNVKRLPRTTVICAVWHGDPRRWELLRGHFANLERQSVPIEIVYVFDGDDVAPPWLNAKTVSVQQELTIYQAWNVGLSLVKTPMVLNLNLDDRLAGNAIELLENALTREGASAIGGDWKICYSQQETDQTGDCYAADRLPVATEWPPQKGTVARLGSGTGHRGTLGPAVMWRMDAHIGFPRYPWRFQDGTPIRVVADATWWTILANHLQKKIIRLPVTIGNYHSHPEEQAEFRKLPYDEMQLSSEVGISKL